MFSYLLAFNELTPLAVHTVGRLYWEALFDYIGATCSLHCYIDNILLDFGLKYLLMPSSSFFITSVSFLHLWKFTLEINMPEYILYVNISSVKHQHLFTIHFEDCKNANVRKIYINRVHGGGVLLIQFR